MEAGPGSKMIPERLSLGNHKAQNWPCVHRKKDFVEIFPVWFRLGQLVPPLTAFSPSGTLALLHGCQSAIASQQPETILPAFEKVYLTSFEGMLVPRLHDANCHGIPIPELPADQETSPLWHLVEGARLIRSLFFTFLEGNLSILPHLPPEFHCGRLLHLQIPEVGVLDIEWTKKSLRCMVLQSSHASLIHIHVNKDLRQYRLRTHPYEKGHIISTNQPLQIESNTTYLFDNYQR